jgi:hypothetical protein
MTISLINAVKYFAPATEDAISGSEHIEEPEETEAAATIEVDATLALPAWDRPSARDAGVDFAYTAEQIEARGMFSKALSEQLTPENLLALGAYVTPGNPSKDGTPSKSLMIALSLSMPALTFVNPAGEVETTRPWNFNLNATLMGPKKAKGTPAGTQALTFNFAEHRKALAARAAKK